MKRINIKTGLVVKKSLVLKYVLAVFLIASSNLSFAQQFEIRYGDSILHDGDYIMHIPTEEERRNDFAVIQLEVCNNSDDEGLYSFLIKGNLGNHSCMVSYGEICTVADCLPWRSNWWRIDSDSCSSLRLEYIPSQVTYTEYYCVKIWDTLHSSSGITINIIPFDTMEHPFDPILYTETPPALCMVTVQDGHNKLIWNKNEEISTYNIFRESVVAGEYEQVASIPYDSVSVYVDTTSRPSARSYRYTINATTLMGHDFPLSPVHKTMHLSINKVGGRWNLQWTPYEGAEYTTCIIYRGTTVNNLEQIDMMPADGNTLYTDENAPEGDVYYQVGVVMANDCTLQETESSRISRSNIATNSSINGISNISTDGISVYSDGARIVVNGTTDEVWVFDMFGRSVRNEALPAGVYMIKIGNYPARKVVVIR